MENIGRSEASWIGGAIHYVLDQLPHAVGSLMTNRKLSYVQSSALSALLESKEWC